MICTKITRRIGDPFHITTTHERTFKPVQTLCGRRMAWPFCILWMSDIPTCKTCMRLLQRRLTGVAV